MKKNIVIRDAFAKDIDGNNDSGCHMFFKYLLAPIVGCGVISYILWFSSLVIDWVNMAVNLLTCISIFTAFIFTIIFFAPEHLIQKREAIDPEKDDAMKNYFTRYTNLTKITISRLSITTYLSFFYIFLLLAQCMSPCKILILLNTFVFVFICELIVFSLNDILSFLKDDINQVEKQKNK